MTEDTQGSQLLTPTEVDKADTMSKQEHDESNSPVTEAASTSPEAAPATVVQEEKQPFSLRVKYGLLKAIDITALGFLEPIVRLCYREEPHVQLKKIGQFVLIPCIFILLFIGVWYISSAHIKTKTGTLPNPSEVWNGMSAIMDFDRRENQKLAAYSMSGEQRSKAITNAELKITKLDEQLILAKETLQQKEAASLAYFEKTFSQSKKIINEKKAANSAAVKDRVIEIKELAKSGASKEDVYDAYAKHELTTQSNREMIYKMEKDYELSQSNDSGLLTLKRQEDLARRAVDQISDERMHQAKLLGILSAEGQTARVERLQEKQTEVSEALNNSEGLAVYNNARSLYKLKTKIEKANDSSYAKAWTLPMQIWRSILCVFTGFIIGCVIAIPIGVLCGLSKTFMAAMTPFIAVFKPVSPIVWLLIFWVVVVGFIPDSETNWFIQGLWDAPLIGWMKINPAFIASALTVAMCSLWATLVNTALGVASVDQDHINVAKVLRLGFWNRLFKIILPSALPLMFAGMRISLGVGWMVLVAAELLAGSEGVGKFTWDMFNNNSSDSFAKIMVMVFVVGFIGLLLDRIMIIFQRMVSFEGSVAAV